MPSAPSAARRGNSSRDQSDDNARDHSDAREALIAISGRVDMHEALNRQQFAQIKDQFEKFGFSLERACDRIDKLNDKVGWAGWGICGILVVAIANFAMRFIH